MSRVVLDALSGREIIAGDEEAEATQPLVAYLVERLGWNPEQMITRPQWRVPRSPSASRSQGFPVDIAIFDSPALRGDEDHVRILVECKAPTKDEGIRELKTYLGLEPEARLGIWFNGEKHLLVYKVRGGFEIDENAPIPRPSDPFSPETEGRLLRFPDLMPPPNLGEILRRLRDRIAAQDTKVNRDEFILNDIANLLICKIDDEHTGEMDVDRLMAFQVSSPGATAASIRNLFEDIKSRYPAVFTDSEERLHLDDSSIEGVVRTLQPYRLIGHDRHAVGQAFQVLRGRALKGEEGAYFTPPPLVDCVISILDPGYDDKLIDPACGTGGFLAAALDHVYDRAEKSGAPKKAQEHATQNWAKELLYAVDKDAVSVKLCKAYLTLLGDGRAHAYRANSIDRSEWGETIKREIAPATFDMIMTNPPFGKKLKVGTETGRRERLCTCRKWRRDGSRWEPSEDVVEQQLGIAFFERCLDLLKPGGRLAIVLPETFLFARTQQWFVDWLTRSFTVTHVVDVPMVAFEEFCRAKTCLVFVTKTKPAKGHRILMSCPRSIGQDKFGNLLRRVDGSGTRAGELDNEMAEAVLAIEASSYSPKSGRSAGKGESRLRFHVPQRDCSERGVLVPRYWWRRDADEALSTWCAKHPSEVVTLGELTADGTIKAFSGHGSPPGNARNTGRVPYVKVTDLKNWRINENPTNFIHQDVADKLRKRGPELAYGDLVSPARASSNIGQFSMVMPWQTHVVLTREVLVLRAMENRRGIDPALLLALMSLKVVQQQYGHLALMNTNREDLGDRWREVRIPLPDSDAAREAVARPIREYFQAQVVARESYDDLLAVFDPSDFGTRP